MKKLLPFLKPYWAASLLAPLLMLLEVSMDLLQPRLMASIIDEGIMTNNLDHIQETGLFMIVVALIGLVGGAGCTIFSSIAAQHFGKDLRIRLFEQIQSFSYRNLDERKTGSLITRLTNDVVQLQAFVQMVLRIFVRTPLLLIGSLAMAIMLSPNLAFVLVVSVPVLFFILYLLTKRSFPLFTKMQSKLDHVNTVLQENLSGVRVIKAFVRRDYEEQRFNKTNEDYTEAAIRANRLMALSMPLMTLVLNVSIVAVLWFGGLQYYQGSLEIGKLIAFINYVTQLLMSMLMLSNMLVFVSRAKVSADRVNEVLSTYSEIENPIHPKHVSSDNGGSIEFSNVSFSYHNQEDDLVLTDISFKAEAGQMVAILGATGAGKTTLVHLIPRLYEVYSGEIRVGDVPIQDYDLEELRSKVAIVMQQAILFSGTIRDNIRYGNPSASDEQILAAAKAAEAAPFIEQLEKGYDTVLGQKGVNLSGGQKQRISLARALVTDPAILILDDSTSAVDLKTEANILKAMEQQKSNVTKIIIAQRISSVTKADLILVLNDGKIVAQGTHEELLKTSSVYQDIYRSQRKEDISYV
ncbi:ABC transporter ATP-binding protein [Paenibacillus gallinarum]|uniref:ABC transporter ATP-binding protein n=1 Tax=Paenibacillus gallinarum TaxID=2762232 RepID=A0ABR8STH3_9BACL|nr:ABC transporter ATP-binding protein [Paenibacillus gallinarum]MBD7966797.1 ABC transporter ATP-binding protein [Paenibacillus gallinarum]